MAQWRGKKMVLALSGGVDSSVAAALLIDQGCAVVACFLHLRDGAPAAADDARRVSAMLDIPFHVLDFSNNFSRVVDHFVDQYNAGRTPNPCIRCNAWMKFGKLADYARDIGADHVATGHYACADRHDGHTRLLQAVDVRKDQSYVLFGIDRQVLDRLLLPIGDYTKPQIREIARQRGLPISEKPESQEICFIPDDDYAAFIGRRTPRRLRPGPIIDAQGRRLGTHAGHQHFTIGQRRGLGVAVGHPLYVTDKNAASNTVTVGSHQQRAAGLLADQTHWLIDRPPTSPTSVHVKIRANQRPVPAMAWTTGTDTLEVRFERPQPSVCPGQAVVCYDGRQVIGGGWISRAASDAAPNSPACTKEASD